MCPTGRRPRGRPRTRWRDYVSLGWPGNASGSPRKRAGGSVWGEGSLGISAQTCCLRDPVPDQAVEDGWMDLKLCRYNRRLDCLFVEAHPLFFPSAISSHKVNQQ
ncbi:hypothetical protein L3Q82_026860 [Scortum barcoo]|uniref:Uncharacterized protein n=1 Tax=Scortum barcoo TaxID=214431 RepID=A0ACB8WJ98_9TELE|nr:hypothetical protein L3Q82_026860 [Scortum barcoo]